MKNVIALLSKANQAIIWDNWVDEETGRFNRLGEVYYCKLDWIKENLDPEGDSYDELVGIIEDMQETICPILNEIDQDGNVI